MPALRRRLEEVVPTSLVRAFADDAAMVVNDFFEVLGLIEQIVDEYAAISCMDISDGPRILAHLEDPPVETY